MSKTLNADKVQRHWRRSKITPMAVTVASGCTCNHRKKNVPWSDFLKRQFVHHFIKLSSTVKYDIFLLKSKNLIFSKM